MNTEIKPINLVYKAALVGLKTAIKASASETKDLRHTGRVALTEARRIETNNRTTNSFDPAWKGLRDTYDNNRDKANGERWSQRCRLLAYGFLRGKTYNQVEAKCESKQYHGHVADLIPDLGDGVSKNGHLAHVRLWVDIGNLTRDQIIADFTEIVATQELMAKVGQAKAELAEWGNKVARIEKDLAWRKTNGQTAIVHRLEADLTYTIAQRDKAITKLASAEASMGAVKKPTMTQQVAA